MGTRGPPPADRIHSRGLTWLSLPRRVAFDASSSSIPLQVLTPSGNTRVRGGTGWETQLGTSSTRLLANDGNAADDEVKEKGPQIKNTSLFFISADNPVRRLALAIYESRYRSFGWGNGVHQPITSRLRVLSKGGSSTLMCCSTWRCLLCLRCLPTQRTTRRRPKRSLQAICTSSSTSWSASFLPLRTT